MIDEKRELLRYAGDLSQLFYVKDYRFQGGKKEGIRAFDVNNGAGLDFTVVADRCLDILSLRFRGTNFGYLSKAGLTSPYFYDVSDDGFKRNFFAGLLTTCGLSNIGVSSVDEGTAYGLHGRISHTPADEVYGYVDWSGGRPTARIGGVMRESRLFGENLCLRREISCAMGTNTVRITDEIENLGFSREPVFILYHFNFGYPLLDSDSRLILAPAATVPRTEVAKQGLSTFRELHGPEPGYLEQVFYHDMPSDADGNSVAGIANERLGTGLVMRYGRKALSTLVQWKQLGEGEYALGLEPGNSRLSGRANEIREGNVEYLEPGGVKKIGIELRVLDGPADLSLFR